ncbi:MAG TPA: ADP-ribosylglycohydrolase family protein [Thermomicrobiales bacterium]|jgi:ADP-ribosylglycohydrolase
MANKGADQERFLGALLGMAIGDALGMPVAGWSAARIQERFGTIDGYHQRIFPEGAEIKAGEFTDESEVALCIVESFTANHGELDADNIGARLGFLAAGESKRWMGNATLASLASSAETLDYQVPIDEDDPATGDVAARGIPIGLIHAIGPLHPVDLRADAELVTRLTHGSPLAIAATTAVAFAVQLAARREVPAADWARTTAAFVDVGSVAAELDRAASLFAAGEPAATAIPRLGSDLAAAPVVATALYAAMSAAAFEDAVFTAVNAGGATDARGAIAGAIAGATVGAGGIPQRLIDELEGRIYVSLAAPWFYRTVLRKSGTVIDLRQT